MKIILKIFKKIIFLLYGDVKIENRIIIGAGTLVNKNLKSGYLYVGNPAKPKKELVT